MIYGFDWDGTLVKSWTAEPIPGVRERLRALPSDARTFIATNQAGPVFRAVLQDAKYPAVETVARNIATGLAALEWRPDLLLVSCAAVSGPTNDPKWRTAARQVLIELVATLGCAPHVTVSAEPWSRKPAPGMLNAAALHFGASPKELIFIGDMENDHEAALAAHCRFQWADAWLMEQPLLSDGDA